MNLSEDIKGYFASEAWGLFQTYIKSLKEAMERSIVNSDKQKDVIDGIIDYVDEYFEDLNVEKLSYSSTLNLLKDLGSPSETLVAMDLLPNQVPKSTTINSHSPTINCKKCNNKILVNSHFCEICGTSTAEIKKFKSVVVQKAIDHLYSAILLGTYILFVSIGVINWMISYSSDLTDPDSMLIFYSIFISPSIIIGSIIITVVLGSLLNLVLKDMKSEAFKIKELMNSMEDNFAIALLIVALAVLIMDFLVSGIMFINTNRSSFLFFVLFLVIGEGALIILGLWNYLVRPEDPDMLSLLKTKKLASRKIKDHILQLNLVILFTFLLSFTVIPNFINQNLSLKWASYANYIGFSFGLIIFFFGNGIYFLYFYSWPYLKRLLPKKTLL
ncbi:MAG: hypothetical protein ACW98G_16220 [Candidatus Hodarchaeales archaeon]|jgi:hypothetical protein